MMKFASDVNHDLCLNDASKQKIGLVVLVLVLMTIDCLKSEKIKKWNVEIAYSK